MPDKKIGTNDIMIGCLLNRGCLYSIPCNCFNCENFDSTKIRDYCSKIEREKRALYKLSNPTKLETIYEEKKPDNSGKN